MKKQSKKSGERTVSTTVFRKGKFVTVTGAPSKEFIKTINNPRPVSKEEYNRIADTFNSVADSNPDKFSKKRIQKR